MSKRSTSASKVENILDLLSLNPSESTLYKSYFKKELWSLQEFAALAVGITPELYNNMASKRTTEVSLTNFDKFKKANKILKLLIEEFVEETKSVGLDLLKNTMKTSELPSLNKVCMPPWNFLK